ncbi:MAG TPA: acetyl-CoA carboxylase carboxyltransferase subunit alpha [Pyrinomonadaceae bacterium]|nr:acetyl-CoA carboxylase carboxyltransferase subunit alpha [Pyrinomonadaceae bacterium]
MEDKTELTAFDRVKNARHPDRPYTVDLLESIFTDFVEIHGDRRYADDPAIVCGFAKLDGEEVTVIGQQKGRDTKQRQHRNFAMPKPEGYRKALRVMRLGEKFSRPIITFIDTPGAYPGIDAEERGQAEAIAFNLREMAGMRVPIIAVVLGEGGSGGALAIGIADRILMMENSIYSVISPEGCAAILWKDAGKADAAADSLRLTAPSLKKFGLIDEIVPEPELWEIEGASTNDSSSGSPTVKKSSGEKTHFEAIADTLRRILISNLKGLKTKTGNELVRGRFEKFRKMGEFNETTKKATGVS